MLAPQKIKVLEWGRGTGKSTYLGRHIMNCVTTMPRGTGIIAGETYQQILTRTLPSTIEGLEMHGIIKGVHYVIGERPPKAWNWPEAYQPPAKYNTFIWFWNGFGWHLVSQDKQGDGRGLNVDCAIIDEAGMQDGNKIDADVIATIRGGKNKVAHYPDGTTSLFKDTEHFQSIVYASSTPVTAKGRWLIDMEEKAATNPERIYYSRANAVHNMHNLEDDYFEKGELISMSKWRYEAEYLNIRPRIVEDGFYPLLNEAQHIDNRFNTNYYEKLGWAQPDALNITCMGDMDVDLHRPLICGIDWGTRINCMAIAQRHDDVFRFVNNIWVLQPKIIDDMVDEFVRYYAPMECKEMFMWYDSTGNINQANSRRTYAEQASDRLTRAGWKITLMTEGRQNMLHENKYSLWLRLLKEEDPRLPLIRFNKTKCRELWISMANAPAKQGERDAIKKNKNSERSKAVPQEHATHLSDAADVVVFGMFGKHLDGAPAFIPPSFLRGAST